MVTDDDSPTVEVPPEKLGEWKRAADKGLALKYGCLAVVDAAGLTVPGGRGTVSFVKSGDNQYLLTAGHVVEGLMVKAAEVGATTFRVIRAGHPEETSIARYVTIPASPPTWASDTLDVAALPAPDGFDQLPGVSWFNLRRGKLQLEELRRNWGASGSPRLVQILGYANLGYYRATLTEGTPVEVLGTLIMPAQVTELAATTDGMRMSLSANFAQPVFPVDGGAVVQERLKALVEKNVAEQGGEFPNPLGGLSGGPVAMPYADGDSEILAVVSKGIPFGGDGAFQVVPIDHVDLP